MVRFSRLASTANYPLARVANLLRRRPQYGANERGLDRTEPSQMRYIRITDVDSVGRLVPGLGATAEVSDNRYLLNDNDILLARSGNTAGKSYMYSATDGPAIFAGYMIRFAFDPEKVNPAFAFIYTQLPVYHLWVQATRRLTGQPNINAEEYRSLTIPIPPDEIQDRIIDQYGAAMGAFKQAAAEAAGLLASIDDYLISELGIDLPPEIENTLANRTFRVSASKLNGWRFDARVHQSDFSLRSNTMDSLSLGQCCFVNPRTSFRGLSDEDGAGFVPMDAISDRLGIVEYLSERSISECVGYTTFRDRDVLWAKITPCMENGKSAVVDNLENGVGFGSTEFYVIRPRSSEVSSDYIHALLRLGRVRQEATRFFTGSSGHQRVDDFFLRKLVIPVPSLDLQANLIEAIRNKRDQAIDLEKKAAAELEAAKREIEAILLGGAA